MMAASLNDVDIPRTIFCLNLDQLINYLKANDFRAPFILKDAQASRGNTNFLLDNLESISDHRAEHSEKTPLMVQTLINSDGSDYRFFVAGGQARLAIKRMGTDGHLNNTSAGGKSELVNISSFEDLLGKISTISKLFHREVTGIDIIFDKADNKPYFLEANPIPQIATGSNVDAKLEALAQAIEEKVNK
jgi:glutathione synthase/RimK-type ligase-like ATP-grasp enzyme